jgi:preprotein translocase subunit SecG
VLFPDHCDPFAEREGGRSGGGIWRHGFAFGPRGSATLLSKATTVSIVLFMVTSMSLSIIATKGAGASSSTVLERHPVKGSVPAAPAAPKPAPAPAKK